MLASSIAVAVGGAIGSLGRFWLGILFAAWIDSRFPWATVVTNISGSFVIGFFATLTAPDGRFPAGSEARLFVMVGLCGGYTTFSAFSLETLRLIRAGEAGLAGANIGLSFALCLIAVWLGHLAALWINR